MDNTISSTTVRVTQASLNQTALDWPRNMANIYAAIDEAVAARSDILALEELAITGYEVNDDFQRTDNDRILASLDDIAAYAKAIDPNLIISVGHPWRVQKRDVAAQDGFESERLKDPLYDRLSLPFNVQTIIGGGSILGMTAKANLYNDERGYEKRYFEELLMSSMNNAGGIYGTINIVLDEEGARTVPFGRPIIHVKGKNGAFNIATVICEEKWAATKYDGYPGDDSRYDQDNIIPSIPRYLGSQDGLVLLIANASPPARDKIDKHVHLNKLAAQYADAVIDTDGLGSSGSTFAQFGHRMVVQDGEVLSYGARMSFGRVAATTTTFSVTTAPEDTERKTHATLQHDFNNSGETLSGPIAYRDDPAQIWDSPDNKDRHFEEVIRYTAFWLFDYMRKTGARGIMEALSGGADSSFNSTLVSVMVHLGMKELGVAEFCNELNLPYTQNILDAEKEGGIEAAIKACMKDMLTCVYMGTDNNTSETYDAAQILMNGMYDPKTNTITPGIGGKFMNRNVQDLIDFYAVLYAVEDTTKIEPGRKQALISDVATYLNANPNTTTAEERNVMAAALKEKYPEIQQLMTAADGTPYENIQARARQVLINLFANMEGKLAIANPNLDEARNGYTTTGGDEHSGNINLNAHLPKKYQLAVMQYLYEHGLQGVMDPVHALGPVLGLKPSAGLKRLGADGTVVQYDEDDMHSDFGQMDFISESMLWTRKQTKNGARRLNALEVFDACRDNDYFTSVGDNGLYNMLKERYNRWAVAQHKIHMGLIAPTLGRNVDHQTSLRTPNLSGQSKDELTLLGIHLMYKWAGEEGLDWSDTDRKMLERRAWQDEKFIKDFGRHIWVGHEDKEFDLKNLYNKIKKKGWDGVFPQLPKQHPVSVIRHAELAVA